MKNVFHFVFFLCIAIGSSHSESDDKKNEEKIVNGAEAERGEFPFMVGIAMKRSSGPFCGGSLLTSK